MSDLSRSSLAQECWRKSAVSALGISSKMRGRTDAMADAAVDSVLTELLPLVETQTHRDVVLWIQDRIQEARRGAA